MTNFERIKEMTIDELAEILAVSPCAICKKKSNQNCEIPCSLGAKQWLESEVEE